MNIFYIIHIILFLFLIAIIFLPCNIQKYGLFLIPFFVSLSWLIFNGCPINLLHKEKVQDKNFVQSILELVNIKISRNYSIYIMTFILILLPTIYAIRITYFNKNFKKI